MTTQEVREKIEWARGENDMGHHTKSIAFLIDVVEALLPPVGVKGPFSTLSPAQTEAIKAAARHDVMEERAAVVAYLESQGEPWASAYADAIRTGKHRPTRTAP